MNRSKILKITEIAICFTFLICAFTGCYSIFSGGTGGLVVDAESTSEPKAGIANVDVYAYVESGNRDSDYNRWREGTTFIPSGYYGHTATARDGSFTISKLVWKENKPDFGKDADSTTIYLLFYHEKYGLTKGQTVIISDSINNTVYAELTAIRKTTALNINITDVATDRSPATQVYVKISVPQVTATNPTAAPKVFNGIIPASGTGIISINYPRWKTQEDREAGNENKPEVKVSYYQSGDLETWKGCYNGNSPDGDYSFRNDCITGITKTVENSEYTLTLYGKSTRLSLPVVNGQYNVTGDAGDDGIIISMMGKDSSSNYTVDLGQVSTYSQTIGTSGIEKHGVFSGLGNGYTWEDTEYKGKYSEIEVKISGGAKNKEMVLRSNAQNYTVQL